MTDDLNAFIDPDLALDGAPGGPLAGVRVAVKDLYDIAGRVTGFGNPTWAATHAPAERHAWAVQRLLDAGACIRGKTHTDDMAYSLYGENAHYGTPENVNAPGRVPGGSSSGSAAATAAGVCEAALGTDTGGSVRIPASYCGLFGLRPTHGRTPTAGLLPLAESYDVPGWFARDPALMTALGRDLLPGFDAAAAPDGRALWPEDLWALADADVAAAVTGPAQRITRALGGAERIALDDGALGDWFPAFRVSQGYEIWRAHGAWVEAESPRFAPDTADRFAVAKAISEAENAEALDRRSRIAARILGLLGDDGLMLFPTAPGPAPVRGESEAARKAFRIRILRMTAPSGLAGCPQISLPVGTVTRDGAALPVGLSVLGPPGADERLLAVAERVCGAAEGGVAAPI
jgi:amidase